ncbi:hypothetical protein E2C01_037797 [Portunus trituberculatus]|uniref:Uncharacterized protein n=1 Tax=Portunus trituberculatus TaxID=210409 RepID=A0A5B7FG93_PORTR|nr:hypothetical protein [Portunus trituberculatus]
MLEYTKIIHFCHISFFQQIVCFPCISVFYLKKKTINY